MKRLQHLDELIYALKEIRTKHGNLPVGGEGSDPHVSLTVCDYDGHDAESGESYAGAPYSVFVEAR